MYGIDGGGGEGGIKKGKLCINKLFKLRSLVLCLHHMTEMGTRSRPGEIGGGGATEGWCSLIEREGK